MIKNLAIGGGSNRMLLIAALVLGLLAAILVGVYLSNLSSDNGSSRLVARPPCGRRRAQNIPAQTVVTEQMLTVKSVPIDVAVIGAFSKTADRRWPNRPGERSAGEQCFPAKVTSVIRRKVSTVLTPRSHS